MITSIRIVNFKNLADEVLRVGPFTVIVGTNASGKSNIRDAFRFLHGIGRRYTLAEIIGGKHGPGAQVEWQPIRGAYNEIARFSGTSRKRIRDLSLRVEIQFDDDTFDYEITIRYNPRRADAFRVIEEKLTNNSEIYFCTANRPNSTRHIITAGTDVKSRISLSRLKPALTQLIDHQHRHRLPAPRGMPEVVADFLESMRFMELSPEILRYPSNPGATILGDAGQNLSAVLESICLDERKKDVLISWLRELTPMDIKDFEFPRDMSGRIHLHILELDGRIVSADSASDGSLRFLGLLAALLSNDVMTSLYFFEEIDNGIHPARLALLVDMLERGTEGGRIQVITTSHSPDLLSLLSDESFEDTSIVYRDEESRDSTIRRVAELPDVKELRNIQGLGRLHSTGWMEDVLAFEGYEDEKAIRG